MQTEDILVSIITPVFNGEKTIAKAIESVLNQTYENIEYIVVDGASNDNTLEVIEAYQDRFMNGKKIKIISEPDSGMYEALNKGIHIAQGLLIGNINADDWYEPTAVEEMVDLYKRKRYGIAWASIMIHGKNRIYIKRAKIDKIWTTAHFCHPTMFALKEVLIDYPYLEKNLDDDFDMILRANKGGIRMCVSNKILAHYTLGGMSTERSIKNMLYRVSMKRNTYARNGYSRLYWIYCLSVEIIKYFAR
ncbi:glycosyltransferase family 2 protein [Butyrivibrio sp. JL13D10]|uniref:glycosyltransferase family 2 protein n=1 Tax=Butyrivibrio sp. JL13D10 TaxID=3236815 RepID=UPI0038B5E840